VLILKKKNLKWDKKVQQTHLKKNKKKKKNHLQNFLVSNITSLVATYKGVSNEYIREVKFQ
jgi:hypothetical protein